MEVILKTISTVLLWGILLWGSFFVIMLTLNYAGKKDKENVAAFLIFLVIITGIVYFNFTEYSKNKSYIRSVNVEVPEVTVPHINIEY